MKKIIVVFLIIPILINAEEEKDGITEYLFGPRTGFTYIFTTQDQFDEKFRLYIQMNIKFIPLLLLNLV